MKKLLIIGFVWPEPKSSAAGSRMLQLIAQFQKQDYTITFATTANHTDNAFDLASINVATAKIELNNASFDDFVRQLMPDAVMFDRFLTEEQFGWRVAEHCPDALRILDTEDFHGLRKGRALALKQNKDFSITNLQNDTTKREVASIYRCDISLMISEAEMDILTNTLNLPKAQLYYLPFLLESVTETQIKELPNFEERQHFVTIGNFLHPPNYDAVVYLKTTIWPLIKMQLPKAELHIYGSYVPEKAKQLHKPKDGFFIEGFAKDVNIVMQNAKVCLAPLRFGGGLKGKLVDAMQNGTPAVMTTIAAEGLFGNLEICGFTEDKPEDFADKATELYANETVWQQKQLNGFDVLYKRFNKTHFETNFATKVEALAQNLNDHRQQNFTGQLLMHHSMQSTKYMGKWIEVKNL